MIDNATAPWAAFALRLALGAMFVAHGLLKIFVFTLPGTAGFFASQGLPEGLWFAGLMIAAEIGGGILLILGIYARWIALALLPILLGASWIHAGNGWLFTSENGGWEYPVFLAVAAVALALLGNGALAPKLPSLGRLLRIDRRAAA